ncbi:MAG: hypothetical protein KC440_08165 [Nitrosarchaeum sp.]|nr:hypothetical protein [Nitrosarchaeum sp.]
MLNLTYSLQSLSTNIVEERQNITGNPTFVLLSCEKNATESIIKKIRLIPITSDVKQVEGMYDIVIRLDCTSFGEAKKVIVEKIRIMDGVRTCITLEGARSFNTIKKLWK